MKQVLVYSDSLSWGIIPNTRQRLDFDKRWPGVLENGLRLDERNVRVVENCLNGRRVLGEDPIKAGRQGLDGLAQTIEIYSPLALVVIMLGNNDFQSMHSYTVDDVAKGMAAMIETIRTSPIEPSMDIPPILIVAPPKMLEPKGAMAEKFEGGVERAQGLTNALQKIALANGCYFFAAEAVVNASKVDGVHLDEKDHFHLGRALIDVADAILEEHK
ncbi:MAG: SGNH/GDSL hydrolase family protein [Pontibacterium sp.]